MNFVKWFGQHLEMYAFGLMILMWLANIVPALPGAASPVNGHLAVLAPTWLFVMWRMYREGLE